MQTNELTQSQVPNDEIRFLEYPDCPGGKPVYVWDGWEEVPGSGGKSAQNNEGRQRRQQSDQSALNGADQTAYRKHLAEESRRSFEAGRERGREEGRQMERQSQASDQAADDTRRRQQLANLVASFTAERNRFLQEVEREVVKLSLAVAARILRREAQMDPLLLTGAVRVALGQLANTCEACLRVPAEELDLWKETMALLPKLAMRPSVVVGEDMHLGDCIIESKVGTVDLGIRSQLAEIERGFFDRDGSPVAAGVVQPQIVATQEREQP